MGLLGKVTKVTGFGANLLTNPVGTVGGYVVDSVTGRVVETDDKGKPVGEVIAIQMKLDRMIQLLTFIAKETNPREFDRVFREEAEAEEIEEEAESPQPETVEVTL